MKVFAFGLNYNGSVFMVARVMNMPSNDNLNCFQLFQPVVFMFMPKSESEKQLLVEGKRDLQTVMVVPMKPFGLLKGNSIWCPKDSFQFWFELEDMNLHSLYEKYALSLYSDLCVATSKDFIKKGGEA